MDSLLLIRRLHQHRNWVNQNLLSACAPLNAEQLHQTFPIGQGTIWKSLLHLYAAEYIWLEALLGDESPTLPGDLPDQLPGNQLAAGGVVSFADLTQKWSALNDHWEQYLASLTAEVLEQRIFKTSTSSGHGKRHGTRCADVLLHVCTHAHYTTAQVVNMLRRSGVAEIPPTMLISLARQEAAAAPSG